MALSNGAQSNGGRISWQEQLQDHCRRAKLPPPVFNLVSDRRGGRTAWSSTVTVQGQNVAARYWYDGQYINNAKEDAAEVALMRLNQQPRAPTIYPGQLFPQQNGFERGVGF
ncbi:hypothetical protein PHISCL_00252 [Aspergillus sclerotialis]|uniref:Uncharacterized protein n=1 Tax=Aspergillus sclerotialis TaxID=2070753 RepID=A0A3A2ZWF8_9EURO|nr:hypothetical protein PHISCL_00252 [Aspergillus sclerotialis]